MKFNYRKYYNLLRLTTLSRKSTLFYVILGIILTVLTNFFFNSENGQQGGAPGSFIWIIALIIMSIYAHQMIMDPNHPIYQFPLDTKKRTFYEYASVFIIAVISMIVMFLIVMSIFGLFMVFGAAEILSGEDVVENYTFFSDVFYKSSHYLLMIALIMPISYIRNIKKRYFFTIVNVIVLFGFHWIISGLITGSWQLSMSLQTTIPLMPYHEIFSTFMFLLSVCAIYVSYRTSIKIKINHI